MSMKKTEAISHFGNQAKIARAVGISRQAVSQWGEFVPPAIAALLAKISGGKLIFDPSSYPPAYLRPGGRLWTPTQPNN
jgi:hypothetical protein